MSRRSRRQEEESARADNTSDAEEGGDGEGSSSSSSGDERPSKTRSSGKKYSIDLRAFHKTKRRLETELRNRDACDDIMDVYCSDGKEYERINPLLGGHGTYPLVVSFYEHSVDGPISTCWRTNCNLTTTGEAFNEDMKTEEGQRELTPVTKKEPRCPPRAKCTFSPRKVGGVSNDTTTREGNQKR